MRVVDCHVHLDFSQFDQDRQSLIELLAAEELFVINIATDLDSIEAVDRLSRENRLIWGAIGLHPCEITANTLIELPAELNRWRHLLNQNPKLVAIGEIGLDYHRLPEAGATSRQRAVLEEMIIFALEVEKPIIFHCRDAYGDLATIISQHSGLRGVVHCFSGNWQEAEAFLELGLYLSLAGNLTYPKSGAIVDVAKRAPLERLLI
ncbi:MAG: TatD family hydrolase, partial [Patescibacteria group bacterium]